MRCGSRCEARTGGGLTIGHVRFASPAHPLHGLHGAFPRIGPAIDRSALGKTAGHSGAPSQLLACKLKRHSAGIRCSYGGEKTRPQLCAGIAARSSFKEFTPGCPAVQTRKQAAQAQALKSAEITQQESFELVRCLLRVASAAQGLLPAQLCLHGVGYDRDSSNGFPVPGVGLCC